MTAESMSQETTIDYGKKIGEVNAKIDELCDDKPDNDTSAKENLNVTLDSEFLQNVLPFLDGNGNEEIKSNLINSVKNLLDAHKSDENFESDFKCVLDLAKALNIEGFSEVVESNDVNVAELGVTLDFGDIQSLADGKTSIGRFYKGIDKPNEGAESSALDATNSNIKGQIDKVTGLVGDQNKSKLPEGHKLDDVKTLLDDFQKIIANPTVSNVHVLQDYIFNNLSEDQKPDFKRYNKYNEKTKKFDGRFGISTLNGLNSVLEKTNNYIISFEKTKNQGNGEVQQNPVVASESPVNGEGSDNPSAASETPETSNITEISQELWGINAVDYEAMKTKLGDGVFIIENGGKYSYDLAKTKAYLENLKDKSRSELSDEGATLIVAIQILLNERTEEGVQKLAINGVRGKETIDRIKEFQRLVNQSTDGIPGKMTIQKLLSDETVKITGKQQPEQQQTVQQQPKQKQSKQQSRGNSSNGNNSANRSPEKLKQNDPEDVSRLGLYWSNSANSRSNKKKFGIPAGSSVYLSKNNPRCFYYKSSGVFYYVKELEPYFKFKLIENGNSLTSVDTDVNLCQAGADELTRLAQMGNVNKLNHVNINAGLYWMYKYESNGSLKSYSMDYNEIYKFTHALGGSKFSNYG